MYDILIQNSFLVFFFWMIAAMVSFIVGMFTVGLLSKRVRLYAPEIVEILAIVAGIFLLAATAVATYELHFRKIVESLLW